MYTLKKSLGQHFLIDDTVSQRITTYVSKPGLERLLEVGPGGGALTKHLVQIPGIDFRCVEVDEEKVQWLLQHFPQLKDKIIHQDVLEIEPPFNAPFVLVGNFPYNISTEIVFRVIEWRAQITQMVGMFQKEVAERIAAREGSKVYGVTSVLVQAWFDVEYLFEVDEKAFNPPPKVKSAVIQFLPRKKELHLRSERALKVLVKAAFNQRRKTLRNALRSLFDADQLNDPLFNRRAEQLSVEEFAALTFRMQGK